MPKIFSNIMYIVIWFILLTCVGTSLIVSDDIYRYIQMFIMSHARCLFDGSNNIAEYSTDLNLLYFGFFELCGFILICLPIRDKQAEEEKNTSAAASMFNRIGSSIKTTIFFTGVVALAGIYIVLEMIRGESIMLVVFAPIIAASCIILWYLYSLRLIWADWRMKIVVILCVLSPILPILKLWGFVVQFPILVIEVALIKSFLVNNNYNTVSQCSSQNQANR